MSVPAPGGYTAYNPKPGLDPTFDAWMATYTARYANATAERDFGTSKLQGEYDRGIKEFDLSAPGERAATEYGLLSRGIGRSGEALRRRSETETGLVKRKLDAERALNEGRSSIEQELATTYGDLAAEREGAIADSRERLLARKDHPDIPGVGVPGIPSVPTPGLDPLLTAPGPTTRGKPKVKKKLKPKVAAKAVRAPAPPAPPSAPAAPRYKPPPPSYTAGGKSSGQNRY